ncbi:hypothetical protein AOQ84DRAFT_16559 [Glonium stellatum]|uniref:Protein kinase domain-containing protein n=1 Tax=Glonium stellatum TaxID=574774 RepID=A0A8E2FD54_9PEZI|nr:hypothetical protein AOQ84DRAFT_16559 [Glonium stellatum]
MPWWDAHISGKYKLLARTNVWQIGMIIWCCMRGIREPSQIFWSQENECHPDDFHPPEHDEIDYTSIYSSHLVALVNSCLLCDPRSRPTLTQLNKKIRIALQSAVRYGPLQLREDQAGKFQIQHLPVNDTSDSAGASLLPGPDRFAVGVQPPEGLQNTPDLRRTSSAPSLKRRKLSTSA